MNTFILIGFILVVAPVFSYIMAPKDLDEFESKCTIAIMIQAVIGACCLLIGLGYSIK